MEFIAELGEMFVTLYVELISYAVPEEKRGAKKYRVIASVIAYTVVLATVGLFVWAAVLFGLGKTDTAFIIGVVAVAVSLVQILAALSFGTRDK